MSKVTLVAVLSAILVMCLASVAYLLAMKTEGGAGTTAVQTSLDVGGTFTLTSQDGQKVSSDIYNDKYKLVYFGFTHCPAICPTELQKIAAALSLLPEDITANIQPMFISVDPERDTPAVLKDYLPLFGDNFVGFTGSVDEIEKVKKQFRIYASKVQEEGATSYTVDHSSYIYFLDKEGKMIDLFNSEDTAQNVADGIRAATI